MNTKQRLVSSGALVASLQLDDGPSTLFGLIGYNDGPAQFIQLFDQVAEPVNTDVPVVTFIVDADSNFGLADAAHGMRFERACWVSNSTTAATRTVGAADCFFTANIN